METSVLIAAVIVLAISFWRASKWGRVALPNYFTSGPLGAVTASVSIFVSLCGGFMIFSVMEIGLGGGWSGYILGLSYLLALPLIAWMIYTAHSPKIGDPNDLFGMNEYITKHYGRCTLIAMLGTFGALFAAVFAGQVIALTQFVSSFQSDSGKIVIVCVVAVVLMSALWYGMRSVVSNDILQAPLIIVLLVLMVLFVVNRSGGFYLPPMNSGFGETPALFTLVGAATLALSFSVRPDVWTRLSSVKSKMSRFLAVASACLMIAAFFAVMTTAGVTIAGEASRYGDILAAGPGQAVALVVLGGVGPVLQVLGVTAVVLALATSLDSYLNLSAVSLQRFFDELSGAEEVDDQEKINQARGIAMVVILGGVLLAIWQTSLISLMAGAFASIGVLVPVFLLGRLNRGRSDWVGWGTILTTVVVLTVSAPFLGEIAFVPALVAGWISFAVLMLAARLTIKAPPTKVS